ncbi:methyltransferase domain-containing protein [Streptomyces sp. SKN60]|uniref:methyltransferase domain-containing protein n=1 Tax=Streptomyces sp. SKN60 TaxID=2855506 RepID=UPI0022474690|nr:methyltransferase domain-containing protein [Streptomyces sp. SKN60]
MSTRRYGRTAQPGPLGAERPEQSAYMLRTAAMEAGRAYKEHLLRLLDIRTGQTALDAGCGPGADLPALAARVGGPGRVIGVDRDPAMLAEARRRTAGLARVELREGDLNALPVADGSVDRAKIDRVLMHVPDPAAVLARLHTATAPGGLVGLVEPDWDTLAVDSEDLDTSRAFTRYTVTEAVRNATVGRSLGRLAERAGFTVETVCAAAPVLRDFETADYTLGLGRNIRKAVTAGYVTEARAHRWLAGLAAGPFHASFTLVTVLARR